MEPDQERLKKQENTVTLTDGLFEDVGNAFGDESMIESLPDGNELTS